MVSSATLLFAGGIPPINWMSAQAKGLTACVVPNPSDPSVLSELVSGGASDLDSTYGAGGFDITTSEFGEIAARNSTDSSWYIPSSEGANRFGQQGPDGFTVVMRFKWIEDDADSWASFAEYGRFETGQWFHFGYQESGNINFVWTGGGSSSTRSLNEARNINDMKGVMRTYALVHDQTNDEALIYFDGALAHSKIGGATGNRDGAMTNREFSIGSAGSDGSPIETCEMDFVFYRFYDRPLAANEIRAMNGPAWRELHDPRSRLPFAVASMSTGADTTIDAPAGALSIGALTPTIATGATVSPPLGAMSLSGFAPAISSGALVAAPTATLSLTGAAPELLRNDIEVPAGALALSGNLPGIVAGMADAPQQSGNPMLTTPSKLMNR